MFSFLCEILIGVRRIFAIEAVNFPDSVKTNLFVLVRMWSILIDFQRHFLYNRIINIIRLRRSMYMKKKTLAFLLSACLLTQSAGFVSAADFLQFRKKLRMRKKFFLRRLTLRIRILQIICQPPAVMIFLTNIPII